MSDPHHTTPETARMAAPRPALEYRRSSTGSDFMTSLTDAVRDNPVAAALIGAGIMWMLTGRNTSVGDMLENRNTGYYVPMSRRSSSMGGPVMQAARSVGSSVSHAADSTMQTVSGMASRVGDMISPSSGGNEEDMDYGHESGMQSVRQYGSRAMETSRQTLAEAFERQPLMLGAAGLALGAGIAASLPVTRKEREMMGSASEYVHQQVASATAQVKDIASAAAEEVKTQASR
jgi:hypothetical protein